MRGLVPRFFLTPHPGIDCADDPLPPMVHMDVLDGDFLLPLAAMVVERVERDSIGAREVFACFKFSRTPRMAGRRSSRAGSIPWRHC